MCLFKLVGEYVKDRCCYKKNVDIFRPGKVFNLIVYIPCFFILILIMSSYVRWQLDGWETTICEIIKPLIMFAFIHILMYITLLSPYIIIKNGNIEYVQCFVIRKKIPLNDIKSCEYETKNAELAISITGSDTKISFSAEFCDKKNMYKLFERIGYLDFYDRNQI